MRKGSGAGKPPSQITKDEMMQVISRAAIEAGVPISVALAFASVESNFDPRAAGDLAWSSKKGGKLYKARVLDNPYFASNPARTEPTQWYSRGLFQLLACYHLRPDEHPDVLFDPELNAARGCRFLKQLLDRTGGDPVEARLHYTGSIASSNIDDKQRVRDVITRALETYGYDWSGRDGSR